MLTNLESSLKFSKKKRVRFLSAFLCLTILLTGDAFAVPRRYNFGLGGISEKEATDIYNKYREKQDFFELFKGLYVASFPKIMPLSNFSVIYIHPDLLTVIKFPFKIEKAISSAQLKYFAVRDNVIEVQANPKFSQCNAVVYYKDEDGKTRMTMIMFKLINPYTQDKDGRSVNAILYPQIVFTRAEILSPVDVLEKYKEVYGAYPEKSYTLFSYHGNTYVIIKSTEFGNVRVNGRNYTVKTFLEKR